MNSKRGRYTAKLPCYGNCSIGVKLEKTKGGVSAFLPLNRFTVKDGDNPRQDMEVIPSGTRDCLSHVPLGITSDSDPETVGATGGSPRANAIRPYRCPRTRARRHVKAGLKPAPTRCDLLESESVLAGSSRKAVDGSAPMPGSMHPENGPELSDAFFSGGVEKKAGSLLNKLCNFTLPFLFHVQDGTALFEVATNSIIPENYVYG